MALISSIGEVNLDALDKSIADTAVDIFVYDTRKDSDGGKWRKRTKKTSWYNEELNTATRGSRREFPAVAVIVAENDKVTIYDGDDPDLPMWMVFRNDGTSTEFQTILHSSSYSGTAVKMLNGVMFHTSKRGSDSNLFNYGPRLISFIDEKVFAWTGTGGYRIWLLTIADRNINSGSPYGPQIGSSLVNNNANDVAITVLPNAPIDPATGLPTPTIAVATDGGVSVIKDDGTVVDITFSGGNSVRNINFNKNNEIIFGVDFSIAAGGRYIKRYNIPQSDLLEGSYYSTNNAIEQSNDRSYSPSLSASYLHPSYFVSENDNTLNIGFRSGYLAQWFGLIKKNSNLYNYTTFSYNTGWMHGDIKGAFLSDTDTTNVTGTELITNGTFDTDTSGWTAGNGGSLSVSSGKLVITVGGDYSYAVQSVSLNPGTYVFAASMPGGSANGRVRIGKSAFATQYINGEIKDSGSYHNYTFTVVDQTTTVYFTLLCQSTTNGQFTEWDDISVRIADPDRSVNAKGLQVFGTITKSPVATGSDLVAYSGWSGTNYLEQPYNSDLNFGTGDFSVMFWTKIVPVTGAYKLFQIDYSAGMFNFFVDGLGTAVTIVGNKMYQDKSTNNTGWSYHVILRKNGMFMYYSNGNFIKQATSTENLSTFTSLKIGYLYLNLPISLFRISASAPTAEQIKKIYEDEKVLFQENAKCTLYGSSDAVTALAYDDKTNLLHVGTSSGRSDFKGLRRINNTTTGITTAISASNRLIAEQ